MPDKPQWKAYAVAMQFGPVLAVNASIATGEAFATAQCVQAAIKHIGAANLPDLVGISVCELNPEFMRAALRSIETGALPGEKATVTPLRVVEAEEPVTEALSTSIDGWEPAQRQLAGSVQPVWRTDGSCTAHNIVSCWECGKKEQRPPIEFPLSSA